MTIASICFESLLRDPRFAILSRNVVAGLRAEVGAAIQACDLARLNRAFDELGRQAGEAELRAALEGHPESEHPRIMAEIYVKRLARLKEAFPEAYVRLTSREPEKPASGQI